MAAAATCTTAMNYRTGQTAFSPLLSSCNNMAAAAATTTALKAITAVARPPAPWPLNGSARSYRHYGRTTGTRPPSQNKTHKTKHNGTLLNENEDMLHTRN